jgi:hypothetical protein
MQKLGILGTIGKPAAVPGAVDAEAETDRIDFLSHQAASSTWRTTIVISLKNFWMRPTRPRARGVQRFMTRFLPTYASATTSSLMSRSWLFSALAMADSSVFLTSPAMRLAREGQISQCGLNLLAANDLTRPRFSFCGLTRRLRVTARASLSARARCLDGLPIVTSSSPSCRPAVAVVGPARRELAKLVAHHVFRHQHRHMLVAVVVPPNVSPTNCGRIVERRLQVLMTSLRPLSRAASRLLEQIPVNKRALSRQNVPFDLTLISSCADGGERTMNLSVDLLVRVRLPLVGLPHGVTG